MPYEPNHPVFTLPQGGDQTIWRYIDLAKLVSLLKDRALYLSRADLLGDPYEGSTTRLVVESRRAEFEEMGNPEFFALLTDVNRDSRLDTYVNCWHLSPHESAAMWSQYAKQGVGVAIKATVPRLTKNLTDQLLHLAQHVYVGEVHYVDYTGDWIPENNLYWPYVHKRKSFEHEKELRIVSHVFPDYEGGVDPSAIRPQGITVPIDPDTLITDLYVAPETGEWFREIVQATAEKFGLERQVKRSSLDDDPVY